MSILLGKFIYLILFFACFHCCAAARQKNGGLPQHKGWNNPPFLRMISCYFPLSGKMILFTKKKMTIEIPPFKTVVTQTMITNTFWLKILHFRHSCTFCAPHFFYIVQIENGTKVPNLSVLVKIANTLSASADELLLDCLEHSSSSANSEIHRLLLDCNETEQTVIIRVAKELKATLVSLGI